jgi:hypothetical protein
VPRAWLKPFGDSNRNIRDDWINEFFTDVGEPMRVMTGSESPGGRPKMQRGDRVVLHAVGHKCTFAAGELVSPARRRSDAGSPWSVDQWPWTYECRLDVWVPLVRAGPRTWDLVPRVKGHISYGAPYSRLTESEYASLVFALRHRPQALFRPGSAEDIARSARIAEIRKKGRRVALPELDASLRPHPHPRRRRKKH